MTSCFDINLSVTDVLKQKSSLYCDMSGNSQSLRTESDKKITLNTLFQKIGLSENGMLGLRKVNHGFAFYSRTFHSFVTSLFPMKGRQIQAPAQGSRPLNRGDLQRATLAMTQDLGFHGLIRRTVPFSHLLQQVR